MLKQVAIAMHGLSALLFVLAFGAIIQGVATKRPSALPCYIAGTLIMPVGALMLGRLLWKKAAKAEAVTAEIVDDRPKNPPA
jgi:hypothetical protein